MYRLVASVTLAGLAHGHAADNGDENASTTVFEYKQFIPDSAKDYAKYIPESPYYNNKDVADGKKWQAKYSQKPTQAPSKASDEAPASVDTAPDAVVMVPPIATAADFVPDSAKDYAKYIPESPYYNNKDVADGKKWQGAAGYSQYMPNYSGYIPSGAFTGGKGQASYSQYYNQEFVPDSAKDYAKYIPESPYYNNKDVADASSYPQYRKQFDPMASSSNGDFHSVEKDYEHLIPPNKHYPANVADGRVYQKDYNPFYMAHPPTGVPSGTAAPAPAQQKLAAGGAERDSATSHTSALVCAGLASFVAVSLLARLRGRRSSTESAEAPLLASAV